MREAEIGSLSWGDLFFVIIRSILTKMTAAGVTTRVRLSQWSIIQLCEIIIVVVGPLLTLRPLLTLWDIPTLRRTNNDRKRIIVDFLLLSLVHREDPAVLTVPDAVPDAGII